MKVKDLPKDRPLNGIKVKIPSKFRYHLTLAGLMKDEVYIRSTWERGVWVKEDLAASRMFPLCIDPKEVLEWKCV